MQVNLFSSLVLLLIGVLAVVDATGGGGGRGRGRKLNQAPCPLGGMSKKQIVNCPQPNPKQCNKQLIVRVPACPFTSPGVRMGFFFTLYSFDSQ